MRLVIRAAVRLALCLSLALTTVCCGGAPASPTTPSDGASASPAPADGDAASTDAGGSSTPTTPAAEGPPPAGTYRILLDRPTKVGAKYKRSVKVTDSRQELLVEGKKTLKELDHRVQITLVADEEVLAVDAQGRWQKVRLKAETFIAAGKKGDEAIVPPGTVLTIERAVGDGDATVTSSSGELSKDAKKALSLAVPSSAKNVSDDDIFGSKTPRAPGASWNVARDVAARDLASRGIQTSPDLVQGDTRIVGTREDRGVPCLEMAARMSIQINGFAGLPEGTSVEKGAVTAEMTGIVPVDTTKASHRSSSRVGMELVAKIPVGKATGTLTLASLNVRETVYEPR
jgi:hypothetical protein